MSCINENHLRSLLTKLKEKNRSGSSGHGWEKQQGKWQKKSKGTIFCWSPSQIGLSRNKNADNKEILVTRMAIQISFGWNFSHSLGNMNSEIIGRWNSGHGLSLDLWAQLWTKKTWKYFECGSGHIHSQLKFWSKENIQPRQRPKQTARNFPQKLTNILKLRSWMTKTPRLTKKIDSSTIPSL